MMVHRPEVCYIGRVGLRTARHRKELALGDEATLHCTIFEFSGGILDTTKIAVLYYYIVDGEYCRDLSDWQYRFWRIGYIAQVHIVASFQTQKADDTTRVVSAFAVDSASQIMRLFDGMRKTPDTHVPAMCAEQE